MSFVRAAKALASLRICIGSHEPSSYKKSGMCILDLFKCHGSISNGSLVGLSFL